MSSLFLTRNGSLKPIWRLAVVILGTILFIYLLNFIIDVLSLSILFSSSSFKALGISKAFARQIILSSPERNLLTGASGNIALILGIIGTLKFVDGKKLRDIGVIFLKRSFKYLLYGLFLGAAFMCIIFFILFKTENIALKNPSLSPNFISNAFLGLIFYIFIGVSEEMFSRGYCMMILRRLHIRWLPLVGSSLIFTMLHGGNPNLKLLGLLNIFLAGILLGVMALKAGNIFMPIGFHITWNYFQGTVFGFPVSGLDSRGIFTVEVLKDNILTGGGFGPEAGILATVLFAAGAIIIWKKAL